MYANGLINNANRWKINAKKIIALPIPSLIHPNKGSIRFGISSVKYSKSYGNDIAKKSDAKAAKSIPPKTSNDLDANLLPNTPCKVQVYDGRPIGVTIANTVQLKVEETEPAIKGATASGNVTKPATLETGIIIQVPMFIQANDTVIVNTGTGEYQGRPGKQ